MDNKNNIRKDYILIFILYTLSFGLILLNQGYFWDDWPQFYQQGPNIILEIYRGAGTFLPWPGYLYTFLLSLSSSIFLIRSLIFLTYLFSAFFLNYILSKVKIIDPLTRIFIVLIFALFNVNSARIVISTLLHAISYFIFFLGFFLIVKFFYTKKILYRIFSLICFFISFTTNSILVFYVIPFLYILYMNMMDCNLEKNYLKKFLFSLKKIYKYLDFLFLPFMYWIIKITFFKKFGLFEHYNEVKLKNLNPINFIRAFNNSFLQIFKADFINLHKVLFLVLVLILSFIIFLLIKKLYKPDIIKFDKKNNAFDIGCLVFGLFAIFLGIFAYVAVGAMPEFRSWYFSRHQLLVPLGVSFLLYYGIKIIFQGLGLKTIVKIFFYSLIITLFLCSNIYIYLDYQKDWFKQLSLMENFKTSSVIKNNHSFSFTDNAKDLNVGGTFYESNGLVAMMNSVFKDESRFGISKEELWNIDYFLNFKNYPMFRFRQYNPDSKMVNVTIEHGELSLSNKNTIMLLYYEYFDKNKFEESIKKILVLKYD